MRPFVLALNAILAALFLLAPQAPAVAEAYCISQFCVDSRHQQLPDGTYRIYVAVENRNFMNNDHFNILAPGQPQFEVPVAVPRFSFIVPGLGIHEYSIQVCETGVLGIPESSCGLWEPFIHSVQAPPPPPPPQPIVVPGGVAGDALILREAAPVTNIPGLPIQIPNTPPTLGGPPGAPPPPAPVAPAPTGQPLTIGGMLEIPSPAPSAGVDFGGVWEGRTASGPFQMNLAQDAAGKVSGTYTIADGRIDNGSVVGNQLFAEWSQDTLVGYVVFTMAPGGGSFDGRFSVGFIAIDLNNGDQFWTGTRVAVAAQAAPILIPIPVPVGPAQPPFAAPPAGATAVAIVTTDSNVRVGPDRTTRSLGTVRGGTTVPVVGCGQGWCAVAVPGFPPGYIAESLLRFGGPPAPMPQAAPPPVAAIPPPAAFPAQPSYTGSWNSVTGNGGRFAVVLNQAGSTVSGTYQPYNGTIVGQVDVAGRLIYRWQQDGGFTGMGVFQIAPDGRTLNGSFGSTDNPFENTFSWFATRQ